MAPASTENNRRRAMARLGQARHRQGSWAGRAWLGGIAGAPKIQSVVWVVPRR